MSHHEQPAQDESATDDLLEADGFRSPQPRRDDGNDGTEILEHRRLRRAGVLHTVAPHWQRETRRKNA